MSKSARKRGFVVGAIAGVGVAAAALAGVGLRMSPAAAESPQLIRTSTAPMFAPPPGSPLSFADIFEKVSPAVVSIDVTSRGEANAARRIPGLEGLPFDLVPRGAPKDDDDDDNDGGKGGKTPQLGPKQMSSGSGFFISPTGIVVTNNHVVEKADEIKVTLKDGREFKATVLGRDESTDLAVLKVDNPKNEKFTFVDFERQAKPRVGDWVITIGNPFGLGGTATAGIISAYGRDLGDSSSTFVDYIQIDAPINRGNSGGPSFDIYGRVVGVNTAIFSPSGGSVGIGFAIPADVVDSITSELVKGGKITRGYIGANIQPFTADMAEAQGLGEQRGAIVAALVPGGPAEKGGLKAGDVVTAVNGVAIKNSQELTREVAKGRPGASLKLSVIREGNRTTVDVRSGSRPTERELAQNTDDEDSSSARPGGTPPAAQRAPVLGMVLAPLDAATRSRLSIDDTVKGVAIDSVRSSSDASDKGLKRGDVITSINTRPVTTPAEVAAAAEAAKKSGRANLTIGVFSGGRPSYRTLKVEG
jgi:serine protease Do